MNKIYVLISLIPSGRVTSYKEIGNFFNSKGYRWIGRILNKNPYSILIPCHRIVCNNGFIGGYASGIKKKIKLLNQEGVKVFNKKIVSFDKKFISLKELLNK
ncbi:MAG TPA: MGMT family protein [Candidatus Nanoarchaeia archaeon]|nr:MGMT family protein [Candidatus Nanoarchaeia archaeon]